MKGKAIIPLALGLCIGLVAVKFGIDAVNKARGANAPQETFAIVWAKQDIGAHEEITAEFVETVETAESPFTPAASRLTNLEDAIGRVTLKAIPENVPILTTMLAPVGTPAGMQGLIKPGFRAVSVRVDEVTSVAYQIGPGDWVDVIVVMDIRTGRSRKETIAEVILQHVQVAAVGRSMSSSKEGTGLKTRPAKSATLLIREEEVPKLHLAASRGRITLSMRGKDAKTSNAGVIATSDVFESERRRREGLTGNSATGVPTTVAEIRSPWREPVRELPCGVTVYMHGGRRASVERTVFMDKNSRNILEKTAGPTSRAGAMMKGGFKPTGPQDFAPEDTENVPDTEDEKEAG